MPNKVFKLLFSKGLGRNSFFSLIQSIFSIVIIFITYRIIIINLGTELLGLWSLILTSAFFLRIFDPTGAATIGRFIAISLKKNDEENKDFLRSDIVKPSEYADTGIFMIVIFYTLICFLFFLPMNSFLSWQIENEKYLQIALELLPFILIFILINVVGVSIMDCLDGIHRADLRSIVMIIGLLVLLISSILLVPKLGLKGYVFSQIMQYIFVIIVGRYLLMRNLKDINFFPTRFNIGCVKELCIYGIKVQLAGIASTLGDPLSRLLMNAYGSLYLLGLYEIATKFVIQARGVLASACIPLIPELAIKDNLSSNQDKIKFKEYFKIITFASTSIFFLIIVCSPLVSYFFISEIDFTFLSMIAILSLGYLINSLSLLFYLQAQASGNLKFNIIGQMSIAPVMIIFSLILNPILDYYSVIFGLTFGLILSSIIFFVAGIHRLDMTLNEIFRKS